MKFLKIFLIVVVLLVVSVTVLVDESVAEETMANTIKSNIAAGAEYGAGYSEDPPDPRRIIENVIRVALAMVGTIFLIYVVIGGYTYLTAQGEEEKQTRAIKTITAAVIGLIVVLTAYSITLFVGTKVRQVTTYEVGITK